MPEINPDDMKQAVKQALKEWLDDKYLEFGKWSLHGLFALAFAGLVYLALQRYIIK